MKTHRGGGLQPGISLVEEVFHPVERRRRKYVCFRRLTFTVPMLLWQFHISCSFPRRDPAQKIIYIYSSGV